MDCTGGSRPRLLSLTIRQVLWGMGPLRSSDRGFQLKGASGEISHCSRRRGQYQHLAFE